MMKKKTIMIVTTILVVSIMTLVVLLVIKNNSNKELTDALRFKEEYESLNNTVRENTDDIYQSIKIPKDNPIQYVNTEAVINIIKNEKAIVYVGANWCPWCRNAVPVLLDMAKKNNIETIYYLELDNEKSVYEVVDKELKKTQVGTKTYYELLDLLSDILNDYKLTDEEGNTYDTNEKRIYMPFVFSVKDGIVQEYKTGTVKLNDKQTKYDPLTKSQKKELEETYQNIIDTIKTDE